MVPYSMTLNDHGSLVSRSRHSLTLTISETVRDSFNEILIGTYTYTNPTQQCHFEWPWVIFSDLAKYSMTSLLQLSLLFPYQTVWQYSDGESRPAYRGCLCKSGIKIAFSAISRFILELIQDRAIYNSRPIVIVYGTAPFSITLNGP